MQIGLISDTHIPDHAKGLPDSIKEIFCGIDLILHAGDVYTVSVLDELECIAPVQAAEGDDDDWETTRDERVKNKHIFTVDGVTILLVHMMPRLLSDYKGFVGRVSSDYLDLPLPGDLATWVEFTHLEGSADEVKGHARVAVFGHTHKVTVNRNEAGVLLINPGSATFPDYKRGLGTVGLLTVNSGAAEVRIVRVW